VTDVAVHDDPAGRTRFAWMRTVLGALAVTALVERGLILRSADAWVLGLALLPGVALSAIAYVRMRVIAVGRPTAPSRRTMLVATAALGGIAIVGLGSVLLLPR
jgi:hypothetical protein